MYAFDQLINRGRMTNWFEDMSVKAMDAMQRFWDLTTNKIEAAAGTVGEIWQRQISAIRSTWEILLDRIGIIDLNAENTRSMEDYWKQSPLTDESHTIIPRIRLGRNPDVDATAKKSEYVPSELEQAMRQAAMESMQQKEIEKSKNYMPSMQRAELGSFSLRTQNGIDMLNRFTGPERREYKTWEDIAKNTKTTADKLTQAMEAISKNERK